MASLRFDQRGHGDSEGRQEELTLATILNDIRVALTRVREATGARRRSLLAASFAGGVCAYYAAKRPDELDRLVLPLLALYGDYSSAPFHEETSPYMIWVLGKEKVS